MDTDLQQDWAAKQRAELQADIDRMAPSEQVNYLLLRCVELHTKLIAARNTIVDLTDAELS